jgi:hypothetical protein
MSSVFLIDGHNLIGQLQDLSLDDPYDEAKLTVAIRRYCMRGSFKPQSSSITTCRVESHVSFPTAT